MTSNGEPRLLIVSADVAEGATVTFDSYSPKSEFGRYNKGSYKSSKDVITYDKGIELKHVMASASIPLFYDYETIQRHKFWDGGILSNTPLREVLQAHRDYWFKTIGGEKPESKVSNVAFDLTTKTIGNLITQGENDAKDILERILRER